MTDAPTTPHPPALRQGSLRDRIRRWYMDHPEPQRCSEVARGIGEDTHPVALACWGMAAERGDLIRGTRPALKDGGRPFNTYEAAPDLAERVGAASDD